MIAAIYTRMSDKGADWEHLKSGSEAAVKLDADYPKYDHNMIQTSYGKSAGAHLPARPWKHLYDETEPFSSLLKMVSVSWHLKISH